MNEGNYTWKKEFSKYRGKNTPYVLPCVSERQMVVGGSGNTRKLLGIHRSFFSKTCSHFYSLY